MDRARLQRALDYAAVAVTLHGPAARPLFARLEAELAALDSLDARAAARAAAHMTGANQTAIGLSRGPRFAFASR